MPNSLIDFSKYVNIAQNQQRLGMAREGLDLRQRELDLQDRRTDIDAQQLEVQRQQVQRSLFKDTYALSQDPRMAASPDAQDAIFGVLGKMAGIPELSQESMRLGRESLRGLYKAALTGDPHQTADAYAELAVRVSNPQDFEKIVGSFAQFDLVREKTEAIRLHKQVEEAKYNQLQDSTVQVEVGRKHYTPAAMHFRDALRGTETPQFSQLSKKITELTIEGDDKKKEVERLLTTQKFPQFNEQGLKSVLEAATQKQQEFQTMADMSTKILDDVHHGVVGMSFAGKAELNHRVSIGQELADAYGKLAAWASDQFSKEKLKAAQLAGKTIEEKRVSMDKLNVGNNAMAAQLKQDAFAFRQSEAFLKHASDDEKEQYKRNLETNTVDAKNEFLSLPPAQQTPEAAAKISKAYREKSGVAIAPDIIMKAKTDPNAPQSSITIKNEGGTEYAKGFAKKQVDRDDSLRSVAEKGQDLIERSQRIRSVLDSKEVITGAGADFRLSFAKGLKAIGWSDSESPDNTETLAADLAQNTLDHIKASGLGTGNGFTEKDLIFLQSATGGRINLEKGTMLRLSNIQESVARAAIGKWNARLKTIPQEALDGIGIDRTPMAIPSKSARPQGQPQSGKAQPQSGMGYGNRPDGTPKGAGYFGEIPSPVRPGEFSTELTIGVNLGGKDVDIPLITPNLSRSEIEAVMRGRESKEIVNKAVEHAKARMKQGKSPYADDGEVRALPEWKPKEFDSFYNSLRTGEQYTDPNGVKKWKGRKPK